MDVKIYKAFIASPSDTSRERILCDKIFEEINSGLGEIYKFRVESLKWEKDNNKGFPKHKKFNKLKHVKEDYSYRIYSIITC